MRIQITIGDQRFDATLTDSAAAHDLVAQLPVTIEMTDHGGVEKTGPLPAPLSLEDQPEGADPDVGDLGYYAPGNDLVLYYGDQSYYPGIVILGRLKVTPRDRSRAGRPGHGNGRGTVTAMKLQDFLDHVNSGAPIQGGSQQHRFMHDAAQEALRVTAEINTGYQHPSRCGRCWRSSPESR